MPTPKTPTPKTRSEREVALAANAKSPIRTLRALELMSELELTNLEKHVRNLEAADPYAAATKSAPRTPQPTDTPGYDPFGTPPNPWASVTK